MTEPAWWPQVLAATRCRRVAAGLLLDHATVTVVDGALQLAFADPRLAAEWRDSGAQAALQAAMQQCGHDMPVDLGPGQETALQ